MSRVLRLSLLVSALLHLLAVWVADRMLVERQAEVFRTRLSAPPRFAPAPRPPSQRPTLPEAEMEYRALRRAPDAIDGPAPAAPEPMPVDPGAPLDPAPAPSPAAPKAGGPQLARQTMPPATAGRIADTVATERLDLVRVEDLLRADGERAVVIPDPDSLQATRGFVKFTPLYLDGAWSYFMDSTRAGRPVLEDLARHLRDHTGIHAEIRSTPVRDFLRNDIKRDPVHFLFPGPQRAPGTDPRVDLSAAERGTLRSYLRGGGFLYIEAGSTGWSDGRRFLRSMVEILRDVLGEEGRLFELPAEHPLYHAFFEYRKGFPGECKEPVVEGPFERPWFYPDRLPGDPCPRGLYGIGLGDRLTGVISDLGLYAGWFPRVSEATAAEEGDVSAPAPRGSTLPFLRASTNIVFHALLRPEGLAVKRALPAWRSAGRGAATHADAGRVPAHLALLRSPLDRTLEGESLRVTVDGGNPIEVTAAHAHGLLLTGLLAGDQSLELTYAGRRQTLKLELRPGRVTTVTFRPRGLGFLGGLALKTQAQRLPLPTWRERFAEVHVEEVMRMGATK